MAASPRVAVGWCQHTGIEVDFVPALLRKGIRTTVRHTRRADQGATSDATPDVNPIELGIGRRVDHVHLVIRRQEPHAAPSA